MEIVKYVGVTNGCFKLLKILVFNGVTFERHVLKRSDLGGNGDVWNDKWCL